MNNADLLVAQKKQFCDAFERVTTTLGTIKEELKVAKTQKFHELSSKILQKQTNCSFTELFLSSEENGCGKDIKAFVFFNRMYIYIPMLLPQNGWRSSKDLGIWIAFPLYPTRNPSKLLIAQTFVYQLLAINGDAPERTLTQQIDLKNFTAIHYKQSVIKGCSQSDFELFLTFILLSWPQANIDPSLPYIKMLLTELESNPYYQKFHFEGWKMYFINSIDLKAFIYFPISKSNKWTIYEGTHEMPKRIYFTANTKSNLEILIKRIKWFNNKTVQIHSVF